MDLNKLAYWIEQPEAVSTDEAGDLASVLREYPYFQAARTLWVNHIKERESLQFKEALSKLAIHTSQREVLHSFFNDNVFPQHQTALKIRSKESLLQQMEVIDAEVVAPQNEHPAAEWEKDLPDKILHEHLFEEKEENPPQPTKPIPPDKNARLSFEDWIKFSVQKELPLPDKSLKGTGVQKNSKPQWDKDKKFALIDKFIQSNPKIEIPNKAESFTQITMRKPAETEIMTETLAKLYLSQKKYKKALKAYKILCLKYPEKSSYFADQIQFLELEIKK